jgi:hypothetical protein
MNFFKSLASNLKKVFSWLGSPQGQSVIATGEAVAEAVYPPATAIVNITNTWLQEAIKAEALAEAASANDGTGAQKAAMVISAVTPQVLSFASQNGLPAPTADKLQAANTALIAFIDAITGKTAVPAAS